MFFLSASALIALIAFALASFNSLVALFRLASSKLIFRIVEIAVSFLVVTSCVEVALLTSVIPFVLACSTSFFNLVTSAGNRFASSISLFFLSASALIALIAPFLSTTGATRGAVTVLSSLINEPRSPTFVSFFLLGSSITVIAFIFPSPIFSTI